MAFCCEMEHGVRLEIANGAVHRRTVGDISVEETMARREHDFGQGFAPSGIGQLVDREDVVAGVHRAAHAAEPMNPAPPVTISLILAPSGCGNITCP